ncbi:MAG TPA: S41 family peptidase [Bryobacteraceae bacterium]|nr:S41 family peptidase [Bryobacteraceae bacterium]
MSERIYRCLLGLYPPRFREAYEEAALQLFRDRWRDERGFVSRVRLWLDLFADLAVSLPAEYRRGQPVVQQVADGLPSFQVLGDESPRRGALLAGGLLALVVLATFPMSIPHARNYTAWKVSSRAMPPDGCAFGDVEILPRSVGYLKLTSFPDPFACEAQLRAAITTLDRADAIILDFRETSGGWLTHLVDKALTGKPLYILISALTSSESEKVCQELKKQHRATLVGERTGGGARLEPDARVAAADALEKAQELAERKLP